MKQPTLEGLEIHGQQNLFDVTLDNGRTVTCKKMENGAKEALMRDGGNMSEQEWEQYCRVQARTVSTFEILHATERGAKAAKAGWPLSDCPYALETLQTRTDEKGLAGRIRSRGGEIMKMNPAELLKAKREGKTIVIGLPNGKQVSLGAYLQGWKTAKTLDPNEEVKGWEWYPVKVREVLADLRRGVHDRINLRGMKGETQ